MAFKEDFEKLIDTWDELTLGWKVILGIMMISQALSVASIGDAVFQFKGFIVQGIEFYHWVRDPIVAMFPEWISLTRTEFDVCVLFFIYWGCLLKVVSDDLPISHLTRILRGSFALGILFCVSLILTSVIGALPVGIFLLVSVSCLFLLFFARTGAETEIGKVIIQSRLILMNILIPFLVVLFFAAISEGWFRATT